MSKRVFTLVAIVGMPGSGKSAVSGFLSGHGFTTLRFGDQTDIGLREHNLPVNEKNERWYREKLRQELGMEAMAIKIEPRIHEAARDVSAIALDGLYSWEEYKYLKSKFPELVVLCVYASPRIRYERLLHRATRPLTEKEAKSRDQSEIEHLNKGGPIAMADHTIINHGSTQDLYQRLEEFLKTL